MGGLPSDAGRAVVGMTRRPRLVDSCTGATLAIGATRIREAVRHLARVAGAAERRVERPDDREVVVRDGAGAVVYRLTVRR